SLSGDGPQSLSLRRGGTRSVTERCAAAQRRRRGSALCTDQDPAGSFRCGNTSQALRASSPQGEPSLSGIRPCWVGEDASGMAGCGPMWASAPTDTAAYGSISASVLDKCPKTGYCKEDSEKMR